MAWIESHQTLLNHPKLAAVCQTLGAERPTIIGHLHMLWWWCIDYAIDGELHYTNAQIAVGAGWTKDADTFVNSLVDGGFLDKDNDGLRVHDWTDFCGSLIDKRLERERGRRRGSKVSAKRRTLASKRVTVGAEPSRLATNQPNQPNPTNQTIPDQLARVDGFPDAWSDWEAHRKEIRKPLTDRTRKEQFGFLSLQPDPVAVIRQSIRNQWRGLFELKESYASNRAGHGGGGPGRETFTNATIKRLVRDPTGSPAGREAGELVPDHPAG